MSTCNDLMTALRQPVPQGFLKSKDSQGTKISYVPWYNAAALADVRLGGAWSHELVEHWVDDAQRGSSSKGYTATPLAHVRVRVTLHGSDRDISREAVGVDDEPNGQRGTPLERAEAAGLRRALAKFGLGLELYRGGAPLPIESVQAEPEPGRAAIDDQLVADFHAAIDGAASLDELKKIGEAIKSCPPHVGAALRTAYLTRQGQIIDGVSKTVKRGSPALVN